MLFMTSMTWLSCNKDSDGPVLDPIPYLEVQSVSPTSIVEFSENVSLILYYEDGDGDLGFTSPDSLSLEVQDSRLTEPDMYHVRPLAPEGSSISIKGTIMVELNSTFRLGSGPSETITYSVRIKDRAGNWSNTVETQPITITE